MDMTKYRDVFLEESADHLAEMSRALLDLEKDPARAEAIDVLFRMAHSIKGMAASLEYESIAEVAHVRETGGAPPPDPALAAALASAAPEEEPGAKKA